MAINGSVNADTLNGTSLADTINGGGGNDSLAGLGGADVLYGGEGDDTLDGGLYADSLYGEAGNDVLKDQVTNERLYVQSDQGNDSLNGGDGNDTIYAGSGTNTIDGGPGIDTLDFTTFNSQLSTNFGGIAISKTNGAILSYSSVTIGANYYYGNASSFSNIENIVGSLFNDSLVGNSTYAQSILGGAGHDTLIGDLGVYAHTLKGEAGNDTIVGGYLGSYDGGLGIDTLLLGDNVTQNGYLDIAAGTYKSSSGTVYFTGFEIYQGGAGSNNILGGSLTDIIYGGAGSDSIDGGAGHDLLYGDHPSWATSTGYEFNDTINGGDGDDTISGGIGGNKLDGGAGTDTYLIGPIQYVSQTQIVNLSSSPFTISPSDFGRLAVATNKTVAGYYAGVTPGWNGNNYDTIYNFENASASALGFETDVILVGNEFANVLTVGLGDAVLIGGAGNDTLYGAGASANATYEIRGGLGDDFLYGNSSTIFVADAGTDTLSGLGGKASIKVSEGAKAIGTLESNWAPSLSWSNMQGTAVIKTNGYSANVFATGSGSYELSNASSTMAVSLTGSNGNDKLTGGSGADTISGDLGSDLIYGGAGNDSITAEWGSDTIYGEAGNDVIRGGTIVSASWNGNLFVSGGDGNDNMTGGVLSDTLLGDTGNDSITGGDGNDVISGGVGINILDGGLGIDEISYSAASHAVVVDLNSSSAQNTFYTTTDTLSNFENISGGAYNDTLKGNSSANILSGGWGDDYLHGRGGNDTLLGGAGFDYGDFTFSGSEQSNFGLAVNRDGSITVTDKTALAAEGTDTLLSVEGLQFMGPTKVTLSRNFNEAAINTYSTDYQSNSEITKLSDGSIVVVWNSAGQDGSLGSIVAKKFSPNGIQDGYEFIVNTTTTGNQISAAVSALADGGYVVVWDSVGQDGSGDGIYFQRFDAKNNAVGVETRANTTTNNNQYLPDVVGLKNGNFVISWTATDPASSSLYNKTYFQIFNSTGSAIATPGYMSERELISNNPTEENSIAKLTALADGGFVVTRNFNNFLSGVPNINSVSDIVAQRFDANGARVQSDFRINDKIHDYDPFAIAADQSRYKQDLVALSGGGFAVAWTDSPDYLLDNATLKLRFYNASGVAGGSPITVGWAVNGATTNTLKVNASYRPSLTELSNKDILVTWVNGDGDISAQRFNSAHQKIGSHFVVNTTLTDYQVNPQVQALSNGGFMVLWDAGGEIYAQSYDASGNRVTGSDLNLNITGGDGPQSLLGGAGNDSINGAAGNDTLDGGEGIDTLVGGTGDDTYYVRSSLTAVTELANAGSDTVVSSIDYSLTSGVENLLLSGSVIQGSGNELNNIITGNESNNSLIGGGGQDSLVGLGGADTLTGDGGDTLVGGLGNDVLNFSGTVGNTGQGDEGSDQFIINSAGVLTIKDFSGNDALEFSQLTSINSITQGSGSALAKGSIQYAASGSSTILYVGLDDSLGSDTQITLENFSKPLTLGLSDGKSNALSIRPYATITDNISGVATGQVTYSIVFDSVVTGLTGSDFVLQNGTLSKLTASTDGKTYTALVSPSANSSGVIKLSLSKNAVSNDVGIGNSEATADPQYYLTKTGALPSTIELGGNLIPGQNFTLRYGVTSNGTTYYFADNNSGNDWVYYNTAPVSKAIGIYMLSLPGVGNNINGVATGFYDFFYGSSSKLAGWGKGYYWTSTPELSSWTPTNYVAINLASSWNPNYSLGTGYTWNDRIDAQLAYAVNASSGSTVSVLSSANQIAEASGNTTQVVLLRANAGAELKVGLTFGGTATLNSDYTISGNYTSVGGKNYAVFASGSDIAIINISGSRDQLVESTEKITVSLDSNNSSYLLADSAVNINVVDSTPQGNVLISGELRQGVTLTASNTIVDGDGITGDIAYQWYVNDSLIAGATGSQFTLGQSQVGKSIKVVANYLDGTGFVETLASSPSVLVANVNDEPVGSVSISGIPMRGQILTADTSLLKDLDGLGQFYYQWYQDDQAILGATNNYFIATAAQANKKLSVGVSYQDLMGKNELVSSSNVLVFDKENSAPSFGTSLRAELGYLENQTPKILASSVQILDDDLALTNYAGATLTLSRNGAANAEDIFTSTNQIDSLSEGGSLVVSQNYIGTVIKNSGGTLDLIFNENATQSLVNLALQSIAYSNSSNAPPASVQIDWLFNDGNTNKLQGPGGALTASGRTVVSIQSVNDLPEILNDPTIFVPENSLSIITLSASDLDDSMTSWSINSGADANYFSIDSATGALRFKSAQNYDAPWGLKDFSVSVRAYDSKGGSTDKLFQIRLTGVNEAPVVSSEIFSIEENNPLGSSVGTLAATDPESSALTYIISDGNTDLDGDGFSAFAIDSSTGAIKVNDVDDLNFEVKSSFNLEVLAFDGVLSSSATVTVNLTNVNEAPVVSREIFSIEENNTLGSSVGTLAATDPESSGLTYSIADGNSDIDGDGLSAFVIDSSTGAITVNDVDDLNFEGQSSFNLTVLAFDGALSSSAIATVNLTNVNEAPVVSSKLFSIEENNPLGSSVGTLAATDPDSSGLIYSISDGNTDIDGDGFSAFVIGSSTGAITVNDVDDLNFEGQSSFNLTVLAFDGSLSSSAIATVNLTNVNEAPTGALTISGKAIQGHTLTLISNSLTDPDGAGTANLQWLSDGVPISGATTAAYTLTTSDAGKSISARLSYTDGGGYAETVTTFALTVAGLNAGVTISGFDKITGEDGNSAVFNVTLDKEPLADVTVNFFVTDTTEAFLITSSLTFTPLNWSTAQDLIVNGLDDYDKDGNIAYNLIGTISSDDVDYKRVLISPITLTNNDDSHDAPLEIYGSNANETIVGNNGADRLYGYGGNDDIRSGRGGDRIYGENGDDSLYGQDGNDELYGGYDDDRLWAGTGDDLIYGEAGTDILYGDSGNDYLDGGTGADTMIGGVGNDTYFVDNAGDVIDDQGAMTDQDSVIVIATINYQLAANIVKAELQDPSGTATLTGNDLANLLRGNTSNNTLEGGAGNDVIEAGAGDDLIIGGNGAGDDTYTGGDGVDTVKYTSATDSIVVDLSASLNQAKSLTSDNAGIGVDQLFGVENVIAGSYNDVVTGNSLNNAINGGSGNDTLTGLAGTDTLDGGAGNDKLIGGAGDDTYVVDSTADTITEVAGGGVDNIQSSVTFTIAAFANVENLSLTASSNINATGNAATNVLSGNTGDNILDGAAGNDSINGGLGNDRLIGGLGNDTMTGGAGNDAYFVDAAGDVIIELASDNTPGQRTFSMGNDNDVVIASVSYTLTANAAVEDMMAVGPGTGASTNAAINLTGNDLAQGLIGNDAVNTLTGNGGDDALLGMGGNDVLIGGTGDDGFFGGTGNDSMSGGDGNDGFFFNFGSASGTNFVGQQGSMFLTGGNDTIDGGEGSNDTIVLTGSLSNYTLTKVSATDYKISAKTLLPGAAVLETATFKNVERLGFTSSLDELDKGNITFISLSSLPIASAFSDTLIGGDGNDTIDGAAGNDSINGGQGNDRLIGGLGNDTMTGGAGNDAYFVDAAGDVIIELASDNTPEQKIFSMGNDNDVVIASVSYTLTANSAVEEMMAVGPGTGASTNAAINLTGNDLAQGLIGNEAANTLTGNGGDDALVGMGGNDTLIGGAGDDFLLSGTGNDSMNGGIGKDTFFVNIGSASGTNFVGQPFSGFFTGGNDTIDGGEGGEDAIVLTGSLSNYTLTKVSATDYKISAKTLLAGATTIETATFKNVERLGFISSLSDWDSNTVTYTSISSLPIASAFSDTLIGGDGNDTIDGAAGNDSINGGLGNDWLIGGLGNDYFVFNTTLGNSNIDTLTDFTSKSDVIQLSRSIFTEIGSVGPLSKNAFYASASASMGNDADDRIIYNTTSRALYYDADGSGAIEAVQFAIVGTPLPPNITFTDFAVIG